ncbi:MAG: hypothetical protein U9R51_08440 [Actinomycetota bacterium]|nr:hypothetical protein [Actinomycetota bacterium]
MGVFPIAGVACGVYFVDVYGDTWATPGWRFTMWSRVVRVATAGLVLAGLAVIVGDGEARASHPGNNGRLVYADGVEVEPGMWGSEIFTMNPDGSDVRRLTFDGGREPWIWISESRRVLSSNSSPAWSPRGDVIAYIHLSTTSTIHLMDPEGRELGFVPHEFADVRSLSWSPDGQRLAFFASKSYEDAIWTIRTDGTDVQQVIAENQGSVIFIGGPVWSPDGNSIAFTAYDEDVLSRTGRSVYTVETDGSNLRRFDCGEWIGASDRAFKADSHSPEWASDGETLYCASGDSDTDIWGVRLADASTFGPLTTFSGNECEPTTSPGGTTLLFTSEEGGSRGLWSHDPLSRIVDFTGGSLDWQPLQGSFWDDERSVFTTDIEWMAAEGITKGCNPPVNDKYCPDGLVTRGQMAAFLVRALGLTERSIGVFTDDDGSVFEADIEKLATAGITKGCNPPINDQFCPDSKVSRGQMAAFLVRALGYTDNGGGNVFVDDDDSIFEADIDRLGTAGVTKGCNPPVNDRYCPEAYVTRGQMAAFLHRALG